MAPRAISPSRIFINQDLYFKNTDDLVKTVLNDLSLTSTFVINIKESDTTASNANQKVSNNISFLAYEAVLPGSSFQTTEVFGDVQGITQSYANKRVYPPVDVSFYINSRYETIKYFEDWFKKISGYYGNDTGPHQPDEFFKFQYPEGEVKSPGYKKNINIVKYERDLRPSSERQKRAGGINDPRTITYTLINAYPTNIISIPVSYDQSSVLRTTITFNYDRYFFQEHDEITYVPKSVPDAPPPPFIGSAPPPPPTTR